MKAAQVSDASQAASYGRLQNLDKEKLHNLQDSLIMRRRAWRMLQLITLTFLSIVLTM